MALVKLIHTDAEATGGPLTADVPESAVHIWLECGWRRAPEEAAPVQEESAPASEAESAPVKDAESAPAPAPETRKRGRKAKAAQA